TRPEALIPAALQAMRVLTDPVETGAVTLALPQDVQAEAHDWPDEFFAERTWTVRRPGADPTELAEAVRAIRSAHRPLLVADGGRFLNLNIAPYDGHKLAGTPLVADARSGLTELTEALQLHVHRVTGAYVDEYTLDKERWEQRVDACYEADEPDIRPTQPQV